MRPTSASIPARCRWWPSAAPVRCMPTASPASSASSASSARPGAGVTSAIGLLIAPVAVDLSASFPMGVDNWDFDQMRRLLDDLAAQGSEVVSAAGVAKEAITNRYTVDMRYVGQGL